MWKGLALGVVAGAVLAAVGWRLAVPRAGAANAGEAPAAAGGGAAPGPAGSPELEAARTENSRLTAELASIPKPVAPVRPSPGRPASVLAWKELGAKIYKLREELDANPPSPEAAQLMEEFISVLAETSRRDGVSFEEAILAPGGMLGLMCGVLEGSDMAPDAAQQAKIDALMEAQELAWKDYLAKRGDVSGMQRSRDLLAFAGRGVGELQGSLTPGQFEMLDKLDMWNDVPTAGGNHGFRGTRESVAGQIAGGWTQSLALDDTQAISIRPIVDEYMRSYDDLKLDLERRRAAGEKVDDWAGAVKEADLLVAAEKRIRETLHLTPAQEEALKSWSGRYAFSIEESK
ncbi:MAG: hypothetical protein HYY18_03580 [Planctomycetes bacterium]|nr:hypothetical protein [Planctomycetota bacterium]